jgi:hypothetical protein
VIPIATQLIDELADIGLGRHKDKQDGVLRKNRNDRESAAVLQHRGHQLPLTGGVAQVLGRCNDRRDPCGKILGINAIGGEAIDQEAVAPQDDCRIHPFALSNCRDEITDARHSRSTSRVDAKLEMNFSEVKRLQSLEEQVAAVYCSRDDGIFSTQFQGMRSRLFAVVVLSGLVAAFGCAPGVTADSSLPNITDTTSPPDNILYALNANVAGSNNAIDFFLGQSLRADQAFAYDLAFDIDSVGEVIVYPVSKIATSLSSVREVGMQVVTGPYLALTSAPRNGYSFDSTFHVAVGTVIAVQSNDTNDCGTSITGSSIFAKFQVLSVDPVAQTIVVVFTVDRNCGFRSLVPNSVPSS